MFQARQHPGEKWRCRFSPVILAVLSTVTIAREAAGAVPLAFNDL
jgi:hypothetical protein